MNSARTKWGFASSTALEADVVTGTKPTNFSWATAPCYDGGCAAQDEETLKANAFATGPISIAVDASEFQTYSSH